MADANTWYTLSKLHRLRTSLEFELLKVRNAMLWARDDLERAEWQPEIQWLTWYIIDVAEEIRAIEYPRREGVA